MAEAAFKALDRDGQGGVSFKEFVDALERFGMHVQGIRPGLGGMPVDVAQALFDKYDTDASGSISYHEFAEVCARNHRVAPSPA